MAEMILNANYKTAVELDQRIKTTAKALAENLFELCEMFYKMSSEKLYKELGYQNFAEYCESEVGIKRNQGFKYAKIGESIISQNVSSTIHFETLGTEKLYLLAKLDEPEREEIQQNVNLEETSVRELKAEIAKLKDDNDKIRSAKISMESDLLDVKSNNRSLRHQLDDAEKKIADLESRPVEVAIQEDEEGKIAKALVKQLDRQLSEADQNHVNAMEEQRKKYQAQINQLEEQLTEMTKKTAKVVEIDAIFSPCVNNLSTAMDMLIDILEKINDPSAIKEARKKINDYRWKMDDIFDIFYDKYGHYNI